DLAADVLRWDFALEQLADAHHQGLDPPPRLLGAHPNGGRDTDFFFVETALDADDVGRAHGFTEDVLVRLGLRCDFQLERGAIALDRELQGSATAGSNAFREAVPLVDGLSIDGSDQITAF